MRRACGTAFLLGALFFFPFPNLLIAPGYSNLPELHVPTVREAVSELPPPWSERTLGAMDRTQWFVEESTLSARFFYGCFKDFLFRVGARIYTLLST